MIDAYILYLPRDEMYALPRIAISKSLSRNGEKNWLLIRQGDLIGPICERMYIERSKHANTRDMKDG